VLWFVDAEGGWFARPFTLDGVTIAWPKATAELLTQAGELTPGKVQQVAAHVASKLPPAR